MGCGIEVEANDLIVQLTQDIDFTIPVVDLDSPLFKLPGDQNSPMYQAIPRLTNEDLTTGEIDGEGVFDALMRGFKSHLQNEFEKNRITGSDYAKTYSQLVQAAMSAGVQYLLGKDTAYWQAQLAQVQAITARAQLETVKVQLAQVQFDAATSKANYALSKVKLSSESINYCTLKYNLETMLPKQYDKLSFETIGADIQNDILTYQLGTMLPAQLNLTKEQTEAQRGQTMNTRLDGVTPIAGSTGKQVELYDQQITSYKRDAEVKAAKIFTDAWITQKTIDEGLLPPDGFTNAEVQKALAKLQTENGFV